MSVSYTSYIIVGLECMEELIVDTVTKYDEDTGQAYAATVEREARVFADGTEFELTNDKYDEYMDAYRVGNIGFVGDYFGYIVSKVDNYYERGDKLFLDDLKESFSVHSYEILKIVGSRPINIWHVMVVS